ncbi:hypothetical protein [Streptomyces sp. NPDC001340]
MEGWKFWWGVAAFFLGGLATQLNGWLTYRRQRKDKADEAADVLRQRREEFELRHLVEVNQLLRDCMNQCIAYTDVLRRFGDEGGEHEHVYPAAMTYESALDALQAQVGFVLDDHVRESVLEALSHLDRVRTGSLDTYTSLTGAAHQAHDALSARVRQIYAGHG